jgi:phytoene dehydrogenase-like protein
LSDVVVIGAGADELVAARLLARAGYRVTVLQEYAAPDPTDGWIPSRISRALRLRVKQERPDPWLRTPLPAGGTLELHADMKRSVESLRRSSPRDAAQWPKFGQRMARLAALLARLYVEPPPSLVDTRFALRIRRLGRQGMEDLMRLLPMPVAELLDEWFECDALKGALGAMAVRNLQQGPRSAGTAFRLLHLQVGSAPGVFRPPRSNLAAVLRGGLTVREGRAARIDVRAGSVSGVTLENADQLPAGIVLAGAHPARVLGELVEPGWLDPQLVRAARRIRSRGVAAKVGLQLERAPDWATLTLAGSLDDVERAYDDVKYGRLSARPVLDAVADGQALEVHVQYVPHAARDAPAIEHAVKQALQPHVPPIRQCTVHTPADLERLHGWPQGQPHHAEPSLDQALWMRPLPELARYATPVKGLWLCGPGMHPGAGVAGACGYNCAREILRS